MKKILLSLFSLIYLCGISLAGTGDLSGVGYLPSTGGIVGGTNSLLWCGYPACLTIEPLNNNQHGLLVHTTGLQGAAIIGWSESGAGGVKAFQSQYASNPALYAGRPLLGASNQITNPTNELVRFEQSSAYTNAPLLKMIGSATMIFNNDGSVSGVTTDTKIINDSSYTLLPEDNGKTIACTTSCTIYTGAGTLPAKYSVQIEQDGTGTITFAAGSGCSLVNRSGHTTIAGRYGVAAITASLTTANQFILSGDTAP